MATTYDGRKGSQEMTNAFRSVPPSVPQRRSRLCVGGGAPVAPWPDLPPLQGRERVGRLDGKSTRFGVYKCYRCRKPFRVTVGTIFEASHIPLRIWLQALALMTSSKKGISTNQLHRTLGLGLKAAWFLSHRIREAMRNGDSPRWAATAVSSRRTRPISGKSDEDRASGRPSGTPSRPRAGRSGPAASVPSSPWSSAAALSVRSMSRTPTRPPSTSSSARTLPARPDCTLTRAGSTATRAACRRARDRLPFGR